MKKKLVLKHTHYTVILLNQIISCALVIGLLIYLGIKFSQFDRENVEKIIHSYKYVTNFIIIGFVGFVYIFIAFVFLIIVYKNITLSKKYKIIFSIFFLNYFILLLKNNQNLKFSIKKADFSSIIISKIAIFLALYMLTTIVLNFIKLPAFLEIPIGYCMLIYFAANNKFRFSFLLCFFASIANLLTPGISFINFIQYYFDYGFCILSCSLASFLNFDYEKKADLFLYIITSMFLILFIFLVSRAISGYFYWFTEGDKNQRLMFSIVFNIFNVCFDYVLGVIFLFNIEIILPKRIWK